MIFFTYDSISVVNLDFSIWTNRTSSAVLLVFVSGILRFANRLLDIRKVLDEDSSINSDTDTYLFFLIKSNVLIGDFEFFTVTIDSSFIRGNEKWKAEFSTGHSASVNYNSYVQALEVASPSTEPVYFVASGNIFFLIVA